MVRVARQGVRNPSPDVALGQGERRLPRMSKEDGALEVLSSVQRQLVEKSFQTYAFEAKVRAKDRDDEHATTPNEVLQLALQSHAASVASLNIDGLPPTDSNYRFHIPKKSLGRLQYEDLTRMPPNTLSEASAHGSIIASFPAAAATVAGGSGSDEELTPAPRLPQPPPRPQRQRSSQILHTVQQYRQQAHRVVVGNNGGGGFRHSPSSSTSSGSTGGTGDGTSGGTETGTYRSGSPPVGSPRLGPRITVARSGSGSLPNAATSSFRRLNARLPPGAGDANTDAGSGASIEAAVADGGRGALRRTDSSIMRRADQMLLALREAHDGPAAAAPTAAAPWAASGGACGPHALPYLPRPPAHPVPSLHKPVGALGAFRSSPTSPAGRQRQASAYCGGAIMGGGGASASRQLMQAVAAAAAVHDSHGGRRLSVTGLAHPAFARQPPHQQQQPPHHHHHPSPPQMRSRSPRASGYRAVPPLSRSLESAVPRAIAAPLPPPAPAATGEEPPLPAAVQGGGDDTALAPGSRGAVTGTSFSYIGNGPPPPREAATTDPAAAAAGDGDHADKGSQRPTFTSGDGGAGGGCGDGDAPHRSSQIIRWSSATGEGGGDERGASACGDRAVKGGACSGGSSGMAPATEKLFTRISRSTARAAPPQQEWVPVFESPLPAAGASSVFTAALYGASPYAAPGLTTCGAAPPTPPPDLDSRVAGGGGSRRPSQGSSSLRPPSGGTLVQAKSESLNSTCAGFKLPPLHDPTLSSIAAAADPAGAAEPPLEPAAAVPRASRRARLRPSLSCSAAEGAAIAAFVQQPRPAVPPSPLPGSPARGDVPPDQQLQKQRQQQQQRGGYPSWGGRKGGRSISTDGFLRRQQQQLGAAAGIGTHSGSNSGAPGSSRGVGGGSGFKCGGCGDTAASSRGGGLPAQHGAAQQRRLAAMKENLYLLGSGAAAGRAGGGAGVGEEAGAAGGGGDKRTRDLRGGGGSPSVVARVRRVLGNLWTKGAAPRPPGHGPASSINFGAL